MPSLFLFKRRWLVGSDDIVLPGFVIALIHFLLFLTLTILVTSSTDLNFSSHNTNTNNSSIQLATCVQEIRFYSLFFIGILTVEIILEIILVWVSMQGSIINDEARKPVEYLVYLRSLVGIVEISFTIASTIHLVNMWGRCDSMQYLLNAEAAIVGINYLKLLIMLMILGCIYDSSGHSFYRLQMAKGDVVPRDHFDRLFSEFDKKAQISWKKRLRRCCCCVRDTTNTNAAFEEASHLMREFFKDLDVVPSDIVAGLVLLRHKQECLQLKKLESDENIEQFYCGRPATKNFRYINPHDQNDSQNFANLMYFCNYAIAAYGPLFYVVYNPCKGLYKLIDQCLCKGRTCCVGAGSRTPSTIIDDDNCCSWQTSAVVRSLNGVVDNTEILYASWKNALYEQPFFVCLDHGRKAVVLTIRGTLSEMDALTDIVATPEVIPIEGNDGSWKCHKGILQGAISLKQRLLDQSILTRAFSYDTDKETSNYKLILVGHSLGAGVAAALSILLRPIYPHLKCYCYSPPGGLLSMSAVHSSRDMISTAVYGKDLVIRTSIHQLHRMRSEMLVLLSESDLPKYKILFGNQSCPLKQKRNQNCSSSGWLLSEVPDEALSYERLYPPGRILHIVYGCRKTTSFCSKKPPKPFYAIEADNFTDFSEILVSRNMLTHHWPQKLLSSMEKVLTTPLLCENNKKYEASATIPSHARLPTNQEQEENIRKYSTTQPPDLVKEALHQDEQNYHNPDISTNEKVNKKFEKIVESNRPLQIAALLPQDVCIEVTETQNPHLLVDDDDDVAVDPNSNNHNNRKTSHVSSTHGDADILVKPDEDVPHPQKDVSLRRSASLHEQLQDDVKDGFSEPFRVIDGDKLLTLKTPNRPVRSNSNPHPCSGLFIDRKTLKRAQIEPNVIPKPPRSKTLNKLERTRIMQTGDHPTASPSISPLQQSSTPQYQIPG